MLAVEGVEYVATVCAVALIQVLAVEGVEYVTAVCAVALVYP